MKGGVLLYDGGQSIGGEDSLSGHVLEQKSLVPSSKGSYWTLRYTLQKIAAWVPMGKGPRKKKKGLGEKELFGTGARPETKFTPAREGRGAVANLGNKINLQGRSSTQRLVRN